MSLKREVAMSIARLGYVPRMRVPYAVFPESRAHLANVTEDGRDYRFVVANSRDHIGREHMRGRFYEPEERDIIRRGFQSGATFVDIGANVGNHAIWAVRALDTPGAIAFEPTLGPHSILCLNVALNGLNDHVEVRKIALSEAEGTTTIENSLVYSDNWGHSTVGDGYRGELVAKSTGDAQLAGIDQLFLKIDVEGHELPVLRGLSRTIAACRPRLFIEILDTEAPAFHDWCAASSYLVREDFQRYPGITNYLVTHEADPVDP
jgi:FkbM family methyltransferase